jgi:hypothetical protein
VIRNCLRVAVIPGVEVALDEICGTHGRSPVARADYTCGHGRPVSPAGYLTAGAAEGLTWPIFSAGIRGL